MFSLPSPVLLPSEGQPPTALDITAHNTLLCLAFLWIAFSDRLTQSFNWCPN